MISATQAYNYIQCPHRVALDAHGDPGLRDEPNEFIEMLWKQGIDHESAMLASLGVSVDLSGLSLAERERETLAAMARHEPLIYHGRLVVGDRVGEPDLLEFNSTGFKSGGYRAGDIKAGAGFEGIEDEGKLKKTYAVQTAHYTTMLDELRLSDGSRKAFIVDGSGDRIDYPLMNPQGARTPDSWIDLYFRVLGELHGILGGTKKTLPALSAPCKLCHWNTHCRQAVIDANDLTLIAELGRSKRDAMIDVIPTVTALAAADHNALLTTKTKTIFSGIGPESLRKYMDRAILLTTPDATPYLKTPVSLPVAPKEVAFDIEADPMRGGFVYLHGFVEQEFERRNTARFLPCITSDISPTAEEEAFRQAFAYLKVRLVDSVIYYYSAYEKTAYKALATRFPSVASIADVEAVFAEPAMVDLYTSVVKKATEWPCYDQSIKTIAKHLGFNWRDINPSGAASIQWFNEWVKSREEADLQRILDYNEDDCIAEFVVAAAIRRLPLRTTSLPSIDK